MEDWISVKDRLPEEDTEVLFYNVGVYPFYGGKAFKIIQKGAQADGTWYNSCNDLDDGWWVFGEVTHWMPLPEVPKE